MNGLWRHDVRRGGAGGAAAVTAVGAAVLGAAVTAPLPPGALAVWAAQSAAALVVGLAAVSAVARESCMELHAALPSSYTAVVARRVAPVALTAAAAGGPAIAAIAAVAAAAVGGGPALPGVGTALSEYAVFALFCLLLGVWAYFRAGSAGAASGLLAGCWAAKSFFLDRMPGAAVLEILLCAACVWLAAAILRTTADPERLMSQAREA